MNIRVLTKESVRLVTSVLIAAIILLPMQASGDFAVPAREPANAHNSSVPVPRTKPVSFKESPVENSALGPFRSMSLKLASLFSTEKIKEYPHGYAPLSGEQSKLYARVFKAQALGNMEHADEALKKINDRRLMGHVLYQRYMHPSYKTSFIELKKWMDSYANYPGAHNIYKLAVARQDNESIQITRAASGKVLSRVNEPTIYHPKRYDSKIKRNASEDRAVRSLSRKVQKLVRKGRALEALQFFQDASARETMDSVEIDQLNAKIAAGFLYNRNFEFASQLAASSADRSGVYAPEAGWIAGLALWQQKKFKKAAKYFDLVGQSDYASGWLASAGSYWAARSYQRIGNQEAMNVSLVNASKHSRTFYGLMAVHSLGGLFEFNWDIPEYDEEHEAVILSHEAGKRAYSLVAAGQYDLAESELMRLDYKGDMALSRAALAYASHVGLPGVALRLGSMVERKQGLYYDSALYPITSWAPSDGYRLDPALIHAVIRQESRFDQQAVSYSGALGLMQIMPKTAKYVAKTKKYPNSLSDTKLRLPEMNMKVGQDYLEYLLKDRNVDGDVVSLLVSYNAGPGNLQKWKERMGDESDTLLFIEMMPVQETRDYVERVLSNYWIYRLRAGLDLPGLTALSNGKPPQYAHVMQAEFPYKLAAHQE